VKFVRMDLIRRENARGASPSDNRSDLMVWEVQPMASNL